MEDKEIVGEREVYTIKLWEEPETGLIFPYVVDEKEEQDFLNWMLLKD